MRRDIAALRAEAAALASNANVLATEDSAASSDERTVAKAAEGGGMGRLADTLPDDFYELSGAEVKAIAQAAAAREAACCACEVWREGRRVAWEQQLRLPRLVTKVCEHRTA